MYPSPMAAGKYNMAPAPATADDSAAANGAVTNVGAEVSNLHNLENPAAWLIGLGALTFGLAAFSVSGRVGTVSASVSAGK